MSLAEFIYTTVLKPKPLRVITNRLLRSITPSTLSIGNVKVALNPRDPVISGALLLRVYERPETKFFLAAFGPGMTFLDIGANVGYYTALALGVDPRKSRVIAMEPDPETFQYLVETVRANGGTNAICVNKAAADRAGTMTLFVSADNRGDNRLYDNSLSSGTCSIEALTVDELLASLGVDSVSFIKMDVQGFEGHALRGMNRLLQQQGPLIFMMEFWPYGLTCAGSDPIEVLNFIASNDLTIFELMGDARLRRVTSYEQLVNRFHGRRYTNIVALRDAKLPDSVFVSP